MQTYKYRFPAHGKTDGLPTFSAAMLQQKLDDGPDCLAAYCIFPTDSAILGHTDFDIDDGGNITAVNLHTYTKLWDGMEEDFKACVQENLDSVTQKGVTITGNAELIEMPIKIPEKLYRISSEKNAPSIMENGIIPGQGPNSYKNMQDYVYLCEEQDLAPWLAILKEKDRPVILEIDTKNLAGLEPGRVFRDRAYAPDGYSEWRTKEPIPAIAIRKAGFSHQYQAELLNKMRDQIALAADSREYDEAVKGMQRLMLAQLDQGNKPRQRDTERETMTENFTQQDLKQVIAGRFGKDPETIKFNTNITIGKHGQRVPVFEGCHMDGEYFYAEDVRQIVKDHFTAKGLDMASGDAIKFRMRTRSIGRGSDIPQIIPVFNGCSVEYQEKKLDNETAAETSNIEPEPGDKSDPGVKKGVASLADMRRDEVYYSLMEMEDRDLCEMVRAHFESHPTLPGEKTMKDRVNQMLDMGSAYGQPGDWEFGTDEKEKLAILYAETRIRETPLKEGNQYLDFRKYDPAALKRTLIDENGPVSVGRVNVELQKGGAGDIYAIAEQSDGTYRLIGSLPDKFLTNSPMNVDSCSAELELTDYSNGNMKNVKARIVVDTDLMSGDVLDLDDNMLNGLEGEYAPAQ